MKVDLSVSCKFWVRGEFELPDDIAQKLMEANGTISSDSDLSEYLCDEIHENDAHEWEFDVLDIEKVEG